MIVITGAGGKTGSRTADLLLKKNKTIRVIGRSADHLKTFGERGAEVMVGDQSDAEFLTRAFTGADAVYLIIPPKYDYPGDYREYYNTMGDAAIAAIEKSRVRKVVFLSSLGADSEAGTGPVLGLRDLETRLNTLKRVDVVVLRAGFMMENILMSLDMIRTHRMLGDSVAPDTVIPMVASRDIAIKAAEFLSTLKFKGHTVHELVGDFISYSDVARIIGENVGIPELSYFRIADADARAAMTGMGVSKSVAEAFGEMNRGLNEGKLAARKLSPGKPNAATRFSQFAEEVIKPAYDSKGLKKAA